MSVFFSRLLIPQIVIVQPLVIQPTSILYSMTGQTENKKTGLLDLPMELLRAIVSQIMGSDEDQGLLAWDSSDLHLSNQKPEQITRRQVMQNLRLTSRKLCAAASQALMPILTIHLNEKSLAQAERLCHSNPLITSGIKLVRLSLNYCPDNLANDLGIYTRFKADRLRELVSECDPTLDRFEDELKKDGLDGVSESQDEAALLNDEMQFLTPEEETHAQTVKQLKENGSRPPEFWKRLALLRQARTKCQGMEQAWDQPPPWMPKEPIAPIDEVTARAYTKLLTDGYTRFQALHQQQLALLQTGQFATRLSRIVAQLPSLQTLCFIDTDYDVPPQRERREVLEARVVNTILSDAAILDILESPLRWHAASYNSNNDGNYPLTDEYTHTDKTAASLLCDIPVALARDNVRLRSLHIQCAPFFRDTDLLYPENCPLRGTQLEMQQAFSALESLYFAPFGPIDDCRDTSPSPDSHAPIADYVARCLASPRLEAISVNLELFDWDEPGRNTFHHVDLGTTMTHKSDVELKSLTINNSAVCFSDLAALCARFNGHSINCEFEYVFLRDGSWADFLDLLRAAVGSRARQGLCSVYFYHLESKGINQYYAALEGGPVETIRLDRYQQSVLTAASEYVQGQRDVNPFRKFDPEP